MANTIRRRSRFMAIVLSVLTVPIDLPTPATAGIGIYSL